MTKSQDFEAAIRKLYGLSFHPKIHTYIRTAAFLSVHFPEFDESFNLYAFYVMKLLTFVEVSF